MSSFVLHGRIMSKQCSPPYRMCEFCDRHTNAMPKLSGQGWPTLALRASLGEQICTGAGAEPIVTSEPISVLTSCSGYLIR